ncbi:hypothetical protein CHS0354_025184 [Potamilus streckersoni]|uniref:AN1-type domain-containing protein n=1 Tax=Potamilus streckersoni TaxID=2493646 RepID=A0AAE0RN42_9BIVA|nr:hypothetical protein CHS0354_025184 [Potamilus streckersoni]
MEIPNLGEHCGNTDCKQLDFLPMKCDACSNIFCKDHIHYASHSCPESYKKDNQVPVCPLCNKVLPLKSKDEVPDVVVGQHIDSDCQSDPARERRKIYTNKCFFKGCKKKELIPVRCEKCQNNFCLRHRFEDDHKCQGFQDSGQGISRAGAAAVARTSSSNSQQNKKPASVPQQTTISNIGKELNRERQERLVQSQGGRQMVGTPLGMSEDADLARAIQMSLTESQGSTSQSVNQQNSSMSQQELEDLQLAQALQASEEEAHRQRARQSLKIFA